MKKVVLLCSALLAPMFLMAADAPSAEEQIAGAVQAAPAEFRDGAGVLGFGADGKLTMIRKPSNHLHCLANDPNKKGFNVACYHKDLEPFMAYGRKLAAEGVTGMDRHKARWKAVDDGKLSIPREPRTLYVLRGSGFDGTTVAEGYLRWVVYTPYATPESSGLSTEAGPGKPWLMYPGTAGAHIMISPPKN
jgi:hypothetical protein